MKTRAIALTSLLSLFGLSSTAFAANGGRTDNSSLVVWIFLGFCALIVVAQLLPLIRATRLVARAKKEQEMEPVPASEPVKEKR
ncbi:MAG: hypothetical protein IH614_18520 [Desulfuromonadales bacterium]|nr:hypothetical protein [Desulfuromonadales bacterium]